MDLSFGPAAQSPTTARPSRPRGSLDLALGPVARASRGAPPRNPSDSDAAIRVTGAQLGKDWLEQLHEWWAQHGYYPQQAALNGEDGTVGVHLVVDRDGHVEAIELRSRSGSQWLDMGALATFRGAQLPPFPPTTPEERANLDITINYILLRR